MRIPNDAYYTPDDVAKKCVAALCIEPGVVLEPSCGHGAFLRAIRRQQPKAVVIGVDIDPGAQAYAEAAQVEAFFAQRFQDFQWELAADGYPLEWVIGNPPYSEAEEHVTHALSMATNVAFLLRLNFLATERRRSFWAAYPPTAIYILTNRPSFTADGKTDGAEYALFHWSNRLTLRAPSNPRLQWI